MHNNLIVEQLTNEPNAASLSGPLLGFVAKQYGYRSDVYALYLTKSGHIAEVKISECRIVDGK